MESLIEAGKVSTVIVKDLSRFGREHLLCGHYTEIVYPTLGVNFIAMQENVDTTKGIGTEMMPFHNIFNEWYAAQTSKKIRAVNEMKASKGMRISSTVPYGYKKIEGDKEQWYIDEPAAEIVRKIFNLSKSLKKNQEFWRCSFYKDGRGTCTIHFIRDVVLEAIVKEAISELADFVRCYNSAFLYLISEKKGAESINREKSLRAKTESAKQRISDLDKLFSRIYEDNILGKLSDERYSRMANEYEAEQKRLISEVEENEKVLIELQKQTVDMKMLYQGLMEFTEMKHLTPTVVNKLIERIEIHNNEKKHSHNNVKVDIYFTAAGLFDIPTEQQLIDTMERVKQKKAEKSA